MLRGASAEARDGLATKVAKQRNLDEYATLGEELLAVAGVLRAEPALRRVSTDASVEPEAKAGLATQVFGGKIADPALDLVTEAVQQRWTRSHDLPDVLERLGIESVVRSAGAQGRRISDELFAVGQMINGNSALRGALSDPGRSKADKVGLLTGLLDGKVQPASMRLVTQAVRTEAPVGRALNDYQHLAATVQDELIATVHTARPLTDAETGRLTQALGKTYGATVHLHVVEDPSLIGGLRVDIGDDVIDGSVSSKLDNARRRIAG
ncbi:MAG: F0F1 ATP synthase subunit delta [Nocardioides sp.]